jgi:hypothetical protein
MYVSTQSASLLKGNANEVHVCVQQPKITNRGETDALAIERYLESNHLTRQSRRS